MNAMQECKSQITEHRSQGFIIVWNKLNCPLVCCDCLINVCKVTSVLKLSQKFVPLYIVQSCKSWSQKHWYVVKIVDLFSLTSEQVLKVSDQVYRIPE